MRLKAKKSDNIIQYKRKKHLNIGLVIFGIIFIYLIATIVMYLTTPHITVYEVRKGSILNDTTYTGLVIRDEQVVYAEKSGYINYFVNNKSKVRVGSNVYTLSDQELEFDVSSSSDSLELSEAQQRTLLTKIRSFSENFRETSYDDTYTFKNDIENSLHGLSNQNYQDQLDQFYNNSSYNLQTYSAKDDGIIVWAVDGMEHLTLDSVTIEHLSKSNYNKPDSTTNRKIESGDAVYKILTGQTWNIIIELDSDTYEFLKEKTYVKVNFAKDNQSMWAELEIKESNGCYLAYLGFEDCIRYAGERYLDIELVLENETGLKIPKSAVTDKDFYVVPVSYITQGGNSKNDGIILRQDTDKDGKFLAVDIYYQDEEFAYLDPNAFEKGDTLIKPDSAETYPLNETRSLKGVYNINKGYVVFKQIEILCENDEYYIIKEGSSYGLSNYDHIVLDATTAKENDVVF